MSDGSTESLKRAIGGKAVDSKRSTMGFSVLRYNTSKVPWNDKRGKPSPATGRRRSGWS